MFCADHAYNIYVERKIYLSRTALSYGLVDGPVIDNIPINEDTTIIFVDDESKPFCFKVKTGDDELILSCEDEETRNDWANDIRNVLAASPDQSPESVGVAAELAKLRLEKENAAQEEADRLARTKEIEEKRKAREDAENFAKKGHEEAIARRKLEENNRKAEAAAAATALESKRILYGSVQSPCKCGKKLSSESAWKKERYIWLDATSKLLLWSKAADDTARAKSIDIPTHVASAEIKELEGAAGPSFCIHLKEDVPETVFKSRLFGKEKPTSIDIYMDTPDMVSAFVNLINEMK